MLVVKRYWMLVMICLMFGGAAPLLAAGTMGTLTVEMEGFTVSEGYAMVAVFADAADYQSGYPVAARARVPIVDSNARAVFPDLPYGTYGVALFHDRNANGELDKNAMGIPREAYGHSNNARSFFGPPAFDKIKLSIDRPQTQIKVNLNP